MANDEIRTLADWAPKEEYVPGKEPRKPAKPKRQPKKRKPRKSTRLLQEALESREKDMAQQTGLKLPELDDPWGDQAKHYFLAVKHEEPKHFRTFRPTQAQREMIMTAAGLGLPHAQLALLVLDHKSHMPIAEPTLKKAFKRELEIGVAKANYYAMGNLFRHTFTAPAAAIFWAKAKLRWSDRDLEEPPPPPNSDNLSALEVARRVAFVLNAGVLNVNLSQSGAGVSRNEGKELRVIEQLPG